MADRLPSVPSIEVVSRDLGGDSVHRAHHLLDTLNVKRWRDCFFGDTIHGGYAAFTGDDGAFAIPADEAYAELSASAGAGETGEYCGVAFPGLNFKGNQNPTIVGRLTLDAITSVKVEFGFTDDKNDIGAVNALATPTVTADDFAVWCLDTNDDAYWQCVFAKAGVVGTKIEPGKSPVALTHEYLIVTLQDNFAKFIRLNDQGKNIYESPWVDALTATDSLTPWAFVQLRGSVDRSVRFELLDAWGNFTSG